MNQLYIYLQTLNIQYISTLYFIFHKPTDLRTYIIVPYGPLMAPYDPQGPYGFLLALMVHMAFHGPLIEQYGPLLLPMAS